MRLFGYPYNDLVICKDSPDYLAKAIFGEDVDFFSKKIILCAKGGDFKKGALDSDFMFVNIEPYKSKKCVPY